MDLRQFRIHKKFGVSRIRIRTQVNCKKKVKVVFLYSAVSRPLDRSKRFTLIALPDRPVHSETNTASPGSILAMLQLRAKTKSLTFPPLSIARFSFKQLERQWRERKFLIFETVAKGDCHKPNEICKSIHVLLSLTKICFLAITPASIVNASTHELLLLWCEATDE